MTGALPAGWVEATLEEIGMPRTQSLNPSHFTEERFELFSVPSFSKGTPETPLGAEIGSNKQLVEPNDVLVCKIVPHINRVWVVPPAGEKRQIASSEWIVIRNEHLSAEYLRYCMSAPDFRNEFLKDLSGIGGSLTRARPQTVKKIPIPLPPLAEQRRIVRKLDRLTAHSTTARTHLTALKTLVERYKLALLRAAFNGDLTQGYREEADLEPVSALLNRVPAPEQGRGGRKPTTEVTEGKGGISVNIPNVALPEGWQWVSLLRVARQETGHTPSRKKPEWWGGDICWVSIPDAGAHHGGVISDTTQKTNELGLANSSARLLPAGTVILSRTASVGYVAILGKEMATSQDFATWTCSEALEPRYLMYALLSEGDDIREFGEGTTHTTIYFPEIRAFHIKLAPLEEQREIVRRIDAAFARIDLLAGEAERALKLLGHLDQRILERAFCGGLVSQNPEDEPAAALLARIKTTRAAIPAKKRRRRAKA